MSLGYKEKEVFGLLNANKKLKAYLQHVIPTAQLDFVFFNLTRHAAKRLQHLHSSLRHKNHSVFFARQP